MKDKIKTRLKELMENECRFSTTTDEYTAKAKNRRFSCVNVHLPKGEVLGIGMIRIKGTFDSDKATELLKEKLQNFGLSEDVVVAVTNDGCTVMTAMGSQLDMESQLCHAHGNIIEI